MKSITIIGKRWFDRHNGNTYCSATIYIDGIHKHSVEPTYGGGDYFMQAAGNLLIKEGVIKKVDKEDYIDRTWLYCNNNGINFKFRS